MRAHLETPTKTNSLSNTHPLRPSHESMTSHVLLVLPITPLVSFEKISEFESNPIIVGSKSIEMEKNGYEILETNGTMVRKLIFKSANIREKEKPAVGISPLCCSEILSGGKLCKNTKSRSIKFGFMQAQVKQCKCKCKAATTTLPCKVNCKGVTKLDREEKKRQQYKVAPHVMVGSVRVLI
jgi:hypothetical protein